ncbi:MAG: Folylpolyglutamate synthase [Firmicutes bacterium ADurb.Bin193]|nr:MAG: Folylpolyglutamate synthase [Firmicutes bacterium ADurb.Bin193]
MNYEQAMEFIRGRLKYGSRPGLETTRELLHRLGNPQERLKFIHVAGTNGKGSTSSFIANTLIESGYKTGIYISPFVNAFTERIQVNNVQITKDELACHAQRVAEVLDDSLCPTEFEVVTAIGFLRFLDKKCDYVVLEVGLGGRFDATNVIPPPIVAVITSISIDHTELLGDTVSQIAFEKSGIIKSGCALAVYPDNPPEAMEVIKKTAEEKGVAVETADKADIKVLRTSIGGTVFSYMGEEYALSMLGKHQVYNAVTAICALKLLKLDLKIKEGLKKTFFKGRLEIVSKDPMIIVDGAHNFSGVTALSLALSDYFPKNDIILVMGMLRDKEYEKCIRAISPLSKLFIATMPDNPRALSAEELMKTAKRYTKNAVAVADRQQAVDYAKSIAKQGDVICVCGSLYLIGGIEY